MQTMNNKIALVTGGSRGLGKATALALAVSGKDLIITFRQQAEAAQEVVAAIEAQGQRAQALQLDVSNVQNFDAFKTQFERTLTNWGVDGFDYLVNNAGVGAHAMIGGTSEEIFDSLVNVQFKGVYFLTQALLPILNDGGGIVNISTGLTRFALPGYAAYASMKGAIEVFTKYLAKELGSRKIRANLVAPGAIDNDFNRYAFDNNL